MKMSRISIPLKSVGEKRVSLSEDKIEQRSKMIKVVVFAILSFFITKIEILGVMSPFGISLTSALPLGYAIPTYIGSMLGYGVIDFTQNNLIHACILSMCMVIKILFKGNSVSKTTGFVLLNTLGSSLLVNLIAKFMLEISGIDFILRLCELALSVSGAVIFYYATQGIIKNDSLGYFSSLQLQSVGILMMVTVGGFMNIEIAGFNMGIFIGVILLNIVIKNMGVVGGAVGGILLALSFNINEIDYIYIGSMIVIASLIAGVFSPIGSVCQIGVFNSIVIFSGFLVGIDLGILFHILTIVIASSVFMIIPKSVIKIFEISKTLEIDQNCIKKRLQSSLLFTAEAVKDLQFSLDYVAKKLNTVVKTDDSNSIIANTKEGVCSGCSLYPFCWEENKADFSKRFNRILSILKSDGEISKETFCDNFGDSCCKANTITSRLNKEYRNYMLKENMRAKTIQSRSLVIEQLAGAYNMLYEMSRDIGSTDNYDESATNIVREYFTEMTSSSPKSVFCQLNKYKRMEIEIHTNSFITYSEKELVEAISERLGRRFAMPSIAQIGDKVKISMYERGEFCIDFGVAQAKKNGESVSGDSFEYFVDNKGAVYVVMSDGMGSGANAAIDSTMTCGIISKLVYAGLGMDSIIKYVNTALQVKSSEESVATIDIAKIDMFSGEVEFYKAGSAASYIVSEDAIIKVPTSSLPVGILNGAVFDKKTFRLNKGNMLIMLSDGAKIYDEQLMKENIPSYHKKTAKQLAQEILAKIQRNKLADDDITVLISTTCDVTPADG